MFGIGPARTYRIDTLIGAGTRIAGDLTFTGGLRIDGEVEGNVIARPGQPSVLVIGAGGRVRGDVRAARMIVNGEVSGSIHASELLELQPRARISGNLRYAALEAHHGAILEVALERAAPAPAAVTQTPPPASQSHPPQRPASRALPAPSAA